MFGKRYTCNVAVVNCLNPRKRGVVVFVGQPVVDHMDVGIGCFGERGKRKSVRRKLLLKAVEFR